jgi:hypothetical protein
MPYTLAWAALLDAGLLDRRGDAAGARVQLEQAAQLGTAADLRMVTAVARMALGDVRGDDAITAEGVVAPLRMAATLAPGLGF